MRWPKRVEQALGGVEVSLILSLSTEAKRSKTGQDSYGYGYQYCVLLLVVRSIGSYWVVVRSTEFVVLQLKSPGGAC